MFLLGIRYPLPKESVKGKPGKNISEKSHFSSPPVP
jgi:hypothetical protein